MYIKKGPFDAVLVLWTDLNLGSSILVSKEIVLNLTRKKYNNITGLIIMYFIILQVH